MTTALTVVFVGATAVATANPAGAWPKADEANCMVAPYMADCAGQPFGVPTSPSDSSCAMDPADAICSGGPFAAGGSTPPPIGSGLPGAMSADGMPYGAPPPPPPTISMPGSIPGMP